MYDVRSRHGHLAPFLVDLRTRAGLTLEQVAGRVGVSIQSIHRREYGPEGLSLEATVRAAEACGATQEELDMVRAMDALDRGTLLLPEGCTAKQVRDAMRALGS